MFDRFLAAFTLTHRVGSEKSTRVASPVLAEIFDVLGGSTFDDGIYRVHTAESAAVSNELIDAGFKEFGGMTPAFGFDWLGRQFAADLRTPTNDPPVLMFEPGSGEVLEIPVTTSRFHDYELIESKEAALAARFFEEWSDRNSSSLPVSFDACVGYKVPLFLGGSDTVDNLTVTDLDVYWTIVSQLRLGVRGMAPGTPISSVARDPAERS
jgi:hypothetical protein